MKGAWAPTRGEIVWIDLDPSAGHEHLGRRPALVLSPAAYNQRVGLAILVPVTLRAKGYPFEVPIPDDLPVSGVVLADQAKSLDWRARHAEFACTLPAETTGAVLQRLGRLLAP